MADAQSTPAWKIYNRPWYLKLLYTILGYLKNVGLMIAGVVKAIPGKVVGFFKGIGAMFYGLGYRFKHGDWRTRMSYLIMGFANFTRGKSQVVKGLLWFAVEAIFILYMILIGGHNLWMFGSLGDVAQVPNASGIGVTIVDDSLQILIFSVFSLMLMLFFAFMWVKYTKIAYETQKMVEANKTLPSFDRQLNYALNDGYHVTVLALPILGVLLLTVLPLLCNILVAFTNFDGAHRPPASLFDWVGFDNFVTVFNKSYGVIIWKILGWTLVWAFFATFSNFFFGMFLAMMINKKSIKLKVFWRTCFVIVIAIPDFVTLLMMSKFFSYNKVPALTGGFNQVLIQWFGISPEKGNIDWFGGSLINGATRARVMVIVVNLWRGMPFTMLATMGILMNIPEDLYESSRIDGAGPVRRFISITLPYIMFVMGPQLITTFTGNINNFNVIYFLTGGGPKTLMDNGAVYGSTDLLVTWLYNLTIERSQPEFGNGAVIGLFTFIISSFFALIVFNSSKSIKQEDTFQ